MAPAGYHERGLLNLTARNQSQIGSEIAAQDLYGLGVRLGFYFQALGMVFNLYGDRNDFGKGLKAAAGAIALSVLVPWYILAAKAALSPSEAIVILLIVGGFLPPAKKSLLNPHTVTGETIGLVMLLLTEAMTCAAYLWTFGSLVKTLPRLGTDNVIFFFARVPICSWFQHFALAMIVIDAITTIPFVRTVFMLIRVAWQHYAESSKDRFSNRPGEKPTNNPNDIPINNVNVETTTGESDSNKPESNSIPTPARGSQRVDAIARVRLITRFLEIGKERLSFLFVFWLWRIITVEITLYWNHLCPSNNIQSPGQLVPLITGIVILIDTSFVALRMHPPTLNDARRILGIDFWVSILVYLAYTPFSALFHRLLLLIDGLDTLIDFVLYPIYDLPLLLFKRYKR